MSDRRLARDISYANAVPKGPNRTLIRLIENATGRTALIRRAEGYDEEVRQGADFWEVMAARFGVGLTLLSGDLSDIPSRGPMIVVANHPFGVLDGLVMGLLLSQRRPQGFRILAHQVFQRASALDGVVLPVAFGGDRAAIQQNLRTRAAALDFLGRGGAIGIFPGGTVSTSARPFGQALDPRWRTFTAKLIARSDAVVVPVFFDGSNSRLFQLASHLHMTLRLGLLIREFGVRTDTPVRVSIGAPLPKEHVQSLARRDPRECMAFLRKATYDLSSSPIDSVQFGLEFEARYKGRAHGGGHL